MAQRTLRQEIEKNFSDSDKKVKSNLAPGKTRTKVITRGPNKGDTVTFRGGPSGKPYPIRVVKDKGNNSTLKNNSGVKFGKKK